MEVNKNSIILLAPIRSLVMAGALIISAAACSAGNGDQQSDLDESLAASTIDTRAPATTPAAVAAEASTTTSLTTPQISIAETEPQRPGAFGAHILGYDWQENGQSIADPWSIVSDLERVGAEKAIFNPAIFHGDGQILASHNKMPTPKTTGEIAKAAIESGMPFAVKPILDSDSVGSGWRGTFTPTDPDRWFASYFEVTTAQYEAAYAQGARHFVIGTELSRLESNEYLPYWSAAIADIRLRFPETEISYSQNWDMMGTDPAFAELVDTIGYSAYFPFSEDRDLGQQWQEVVDRIVELEDETDIPRKVSEYGMSLTGSLSAPFGEDKDGSRGIEPNPKLVEEYVLAGCAAMQTAGIEYDLWAGSYMTSWIRDGVNLDETRSFYLGAPGNWRLAANIAVGCASD